MNRTDPSNWKALAEAENGQTNKTQQRTVTFKGAKGGKEFRTSPDEAYKFVNIKGGHVISVGDKVLPSRPGHPGV